MTATPHGSYRQRASEGVQSGDCIYAIKFFFKCHETLAVDTDFFSLSGRVELVLLIMSAWWINEKAVFFFNWGSSLKSIFLICFSHVFIFTFLLIEYACQEIYFPHIFVSYFPSTTVKSKYTANILDGFASTAVDQFFEFFINIFTQAEPLFVVQPCWWNAYHTVHYSDVLIESLKYLSEFLLHLRNEGAFESM